MKGYTKNMICPDCKKNKSYQVKSDGVFRCCECTYKKNFYKVKNIKDFLSFNKSYLKHKIEEWF